MALSGTWHLITGSTGAGKSTLARELVQCHNAVRFAIDEWMNTLFWQDCPEKNDYPWAIERVRRCRTCSIYSDESNVKRAPYSI
jgi:predicted kinase